MTVEPRAAADLLHASRSANALSPVVRRRVAIGYSSRGIRERTTIARADSTPDRLPRVHRALF